MKKKMSKPPAPMPMAPSPMPAPGGDPMGMRSGGKTKRMASGGGVTRADGAVMKGHTKGRMC